MLTKNTHRLDEQLIAAIKCSARANGWSLRVTDYLAHLSGQAQRPPLVTPTASPITSRLRGVLKAASATEADHWIV